MADLVFWLLLFSTMASLCSAAIDRHMAAKFKRQRDEALAEIFVRDLRGYTGSDEQ